MIEAREDTRKARKQTKLDEFDSYIYEAIWVMETYTNTNMLHNEDDDDRFASDYAAGILCKLISYLPQKKRPNLRELEELRSLLGSVTSYLIQFAEKHRNTHTLIEIDENWFEQFKYGSKFTILNRALEVAMHIYDKAAAEIIARLLPRTRNWETITGRALHPEGEIHKRERETFRSEINGEEFEHVHQNRARQRRALNERQYFNHRGFIGELPRHLRAPNHSRAYNIVDVD